MSKGKIRINWFVDFDKEERWLNDMCSKGWAFWHTNGLIYRFKECEPGEFIYQIDFDEGTSNKGTANEGVGDYVVFRSSCGDQFVNQWKRKIYWKRASSAGPFEEESNVAAKLRLTNKAFSYHFNSFIGLTLIAAFDFLILMPLGRHLPAGTFATWLTEFSMGLTYGIFIAELILLLPALNKLHKKLNELTGQIF